MRAKRAYLRTRCAILPGMNLLFAIIGLGVLILVHEAGHMFVARWMGMRVDRFSLGFGPILLRWRGKHTIYQLALVPLGGFVQIAGMNPHEELPEGDPGSYANKAPSARFATILAGPLTNYLFAILIMFSVLMIWGQPHRQEVVTVHEVLEGTPAAKAGLKKKDIIEKIGGQAIANREEAIQQIGASKGRPVVLDLRRGEETLALRVTPEAQAGTYRIGIAFPPNQSLGKITFLPMGAREAAIKSLVFPVIQTERALAGFGSIFAGKASVKQVGGPLKIVEQLKMSFAHSFAMAMLFLAMLNVYLGMFNLLPVPALDGGRLVFLIFTMISRRPVNQRIEGMIHMVGFLLLLGLILLVSFKDVLGFFDK